jgi:hypothetical protein
MQSKIDEERFARFMEKAAVQVSAFEQRENSRVEKRYGIAMQDSAVILAELTQDASFEELIEAEQTLQKNDLTVYAQRSETLESVREGISDINAGLAAYRLLVRNTAEYKAHPYRKKERLPPEHILPLDAMRRALRGQIKRVENYRSNVMGNIKEQEFLSARIAILHRAEALYDAMQRERLLPDTEPPAQA